MELDAPSRPLLPHWQSARLRLSGGECDRRVGSARSDQDGAAAKRVFGERVTRSALLAGSRAAVRADARAARRRAGPAGPPGRAARRRPTRRCRPTADQVQFTAATLEYDTDTDIVTATGDVRMYRQGDRLRADKVVWNRKTGKVVATGNIAVTNPAGRRRLWRFDRADRLAEGRRGRQHAGRARTGRPAGGAVKGTRDDDGVVTLEDAAYTPCAVTDCGRLPQGAVVEDHRGAAWSIAPTGKRIYYTGARFNLFGLPTIPLPEFSQPGRRRQRQRPAEPRLRYSRSTGFEVARALLFPPRAQSRR